MSLRPDVAAMEKKYQIGRVLWRSELRMISALLAPEEELLFMWQGTWVGTHLPSGKKDRRYGGVAVVTDQRVFHANLAGTAEVALSEIQAVRLDRNGVSFTKPEWHILAKTGGAELERKLNEAIAASAARVSVNQKRIICERCGAQALVSPGRAAQCDYCDGCLQL